ncbi:hypothetical protein [Cryptosporangium phraense]|uniref:Uncharacterized protein n=1 Tax=Cryptosporangium phraense TaxID=2593070 RepID=A0A545ARL3_9ACTN|nr:hypothetical protein [Cryptosporangium phraense]TQS43913.1 hypothetical protein FL583_15735 [Cryptosporangium phraense]
MTETRDLLRLLDPADAELSVDQHQRAAASLERILAEPVTQPRRSRRLLAAAAAACALAAGAVTFFHTGDDGQAYASWTPAPRPLTHDEAGRLGSQCRRWLRGSMLDARRAHLALAERRGEFVVLLYRTDVPDMSGDCLLRNPAGTDDVDLIGAGATGSDAPARPAPLGALVEGGFSQFHEASVTDGAVGRDVTGVTVHAGKFTVEATVHDGRHAAWWPGPAFDSTEPPESGQWAPTSIVHYDLTLTDGTVRRDVHPVRPG